MFWDLPYWPILGTPNCLDLMHVTKNVFESLFGTVVNMADRTKDGPKARRDLKHYGLRIELHGGTEKRPGKIIRVTKQTVTGTKGLRGIMTIISPLLLYSARE